MKTAICAIAKNENNYIKEWCDYHLELGFDKIYVFDNNDNNGERISDAVSCDSVVIDNRFRGKNDRMHQGDAYISFYREKSKYYDWVAFIDIDEFIYLEKHKNISDFLSENFFENPDGVKLCWKCYTDNNLVRVVDNNYSVTRFTVPCETYSTQSKTIMRGNLSYVTSIGAHGSPNLRHVVDATGKPCWNGRDLKYSVNIGEKHVWDNAYIKHYRFKTIEEFLDVKMRNWNQRNIKNKYISLKYFWDINEKTPEKINYLKNNGIIPFSLVDISANSKNHSRA